jgi:hypothetical protein
LLKGRNIHCISLSSLRVGKALNTFEPSRSVTTKPSQGWEPGRGLPQNFSHTPWYFQAMIPYF